jgi:sporulation protein YlmC with PRC-barrel domain
MKMNTKSLLKMMAAAPLLTLTAIAGCDTADDRDSYAERPTQELSPQDDQSLADTRDTRPMDRTTTTAGDSSYAQPGQTQPRQSSDQSWDTADRQAGITWPASDMEGQTIYNRDGEEIGTIASVVTDDNGESKFAVVDVGDFLGIGGKQVAIDIRHLQLTADGQIQSEVTSDVLESMPEYDSSDYEEDMQ